MFYVGLAPISDARLVPATIAQVLGVSGEERQPHLETVKNYLRDRQLLLILDNFEQVLGAAVDVGELIDVCPRLHVIVTSRAPLRLVGEQEFPVPPLALPDHGVHTPAALATCESVQLFVERGRSGLTLR